VIAIISVLIGLVLPAVQKVRAAAARTKCANNLKQLALAAHNYHDVKGAMPQGCSYEAGKASLLHASWLNRLLPYVEQEAMWKQTLDAYSQNSFFETPPHFANLRTVVPPFVCPAEPMARESWDFGTFAVAFTDYLGVWGTDHHKFDGVLFLDSGVRFDDITDGTSNTLLIGERPPSADHFLGWWYAGWGQSKDGSTEYILGVRELNDHPRYTRICPPGPYHFTAPKAGYVCDLFHFWSYHSGGANFACADGSVRFLSYSADPIMPALATRAGGEVVTVPD
jgi:prepilin-type processing-associated H-X9-DG protein